MSKDINTEGDFDCARGFREAKHTLTRCKDCQWIHEADSIKQTSFKGVEFCPRHNRAVNSHEELLAVLNWAITDCRECRVTERCERCAIFKKAIEKAEHK